MLKPKLFYKYRTILVKTEPWFKTYIERSMAKMLVANINQPKKGKFMVTISSGVTEGSA